MKHIKILLIGVLACAGGLAVIAALWSALYFGIHWLDDVLEPHKNTAFQLISGLLILCCFYAMGFSVLKWRDENK